MGTSHLTWPLASAEVIHTPEALTRVCLLTHVQRRRLPLSLPSYSLNGHVCPSTHHHRHRSEQVCTTRDARGNLLTNGPCSSGVGFGICQRLLNHLSQKFPPDAEPQFKSLFPGKAPEDTAPTESYDGLTLILACRSETKALHARQKLLRRLDRHIAVEERKPGYDGHAERFRAHLEINFHSVDMSVASSTFKFCEEIRNT